MYKAMFLSYFLARNVSVCKSGWHNYLYNVVLFCRYAWLYIFIYLLIFLLNNPHHCALIYFLCSNIILRYIYLIGGRELSDYFNPLPHGGRPFWPNTSLHANYSKCAEGKVSSKNRYSSSWILCLLWNHNINYIGHNKPVINFLVNHSKIGGYGWPPLW